MRFLLCILLTLKIVFSAIIEPANHKIKGWEEIGKTNPEQPIQLLFALKNENIKQLEELLIAVSTPGNKEYGNHRSISELRSFIAPSKIATDSVMNFLSSHTNNTIHVESANNDLLSISTTISQAETLLNCSYFDYENTDKSMIVARIKLGETYEINSNVSKHLYFVSPTIRFPDLNTIFPKIDTIDTNAATKITPTELRALYNVGTASGSASNNIQGIASFQTEFYTMSDLIALWNAYDITPCNVTNIPSNSSSGYGLEAELDTQYISSMGQSIPMQVWLTPGRKFEDDLLEFTENVLNSTNPPDLFSISYGVIESYMSNSYLTKMNNQFMVMGSAGISVLFASGDSGAGGGCQGNEAFEPVWPASSPYVTAVGGVYGGIDHDSDESDDTTGEVAWAYGGGGFSNIEAIQSWQSTAVEYYLSNERNLPANGKFNKSGRGYPDIAAQSVSFEIYVEGKVKTVSGTSCASPTAGGIFALLNDLRKQNKMSNLGFLNPFIYQTAEKDSTAFNDIVKGTDYGCAESVGWDIGFLAAEKWDPTSGFGTPNYQKLSTYVIQTGLETVKYNQ